VGETQRVLVLATTLRGPLGMPPSRGVSDSFSAGTKIAPSTWLISMSSRCGGMITPRQAGNRISKEVIRESNA
jgi:hypothetical protein